jgi:tRNA modification GTPase
MPALLAGVFGNMMNDKTAQTIYACATAAGRAALAVVRVSGPDCRAVLSGLDATCPPPRQASVRRLCHPHTQDMLDEALVLYFAGPHSYTGEDVAELHLHGGTAVVASVLEALAHLPICRPAEAGEFTRRAVLHGKLDLTRAEAIADLIDAETTAQQVQALGQLLGNLRDLFEGWRNALHTVLAHLEADLEFADEDLPGGLGRSALDTVPELRAAVAGFIGDRRGLQLRAGLRIALIGAPNAGKSSLLNRLAGRDAAIVSARAGTTRDIIEIAMTLAGVPVTLIDTAGLRAAGDDIEREGVRRALAAARDADVRILVSAPDANAELPPEEQHLPPPEFHLINKSDLGTASCEASDPESSDAASVHGVSALTGDGIDEFIEALSAFVREQYASSGSAVLTRQRHQQILTEVLAALDRALASQSRGLELAAEDLRLAARALGQLTGAVDVEALLDIVFADFCIGK